jgi:transposase InsO family protein
VRRDKGVTQLADKVQTALLQIKQENPARSINTLIHMLESRGMVAKGQLARATVHRFLHHHKLSKRIVADSHTIERRSFVAEHAGDIWHGDVLHGPSIQTPSGMKKTYLVSLLDDASRLIAHSAFCFGETALDIEGVLKQAVLKRGIPYKLIIDNGPAYRAATLQSICALLEIRLIYCRPYEPEGKGKLERYHRTFREQFLNEINAEKIAGLHELNDRLWAWLEHVYHRRRHTGLDNKTPLDRWREDLIHVRPLGFKASKIDDIFYHRVERTVKKDGTVSWEGMRFEVPYEQVNEKVQLVIDPHAHKALRIESAFGDDLGSVTPLDAHANLNRKRQRPHHAPASLQKQTENAVEIAYREYSRLCAIPLSTQSTKEEKSSCIDNTSD